MDELKNILIQFFREFNLLLFPFVSSQLVFWMIVSKFIQIKKFTNKTVVAFTSIQYNGNSKAVFEYMKNLEEYECYWIARNRKSMRDVRENNGKSIYAFFPIISVKYLLNTDVLVTADSALEVLFNHNLKVVQLWHGVCPKGYTIPRYDFDAWCMASEYIKQRNIKIQDLSPKKLHVTGHAALDNLLKYLKDEKIRNKFSKEYNTREKIILYAPTWDCGLWGWGDQYNQFEKLCLFCKDNNITLILRLHPLAKINRMHLKKIVKKYGVLWLDMDKEPDTMKLLSVSDIAITDWSSITTDFLLTKRPIIYFDIDKEYFTKTRGEPEIPPEYRAGEIVHHEKEFYDILNIVLTKGNRFEKKQDESLKLIHGNVDGKASERVANIVKRIIK